MLNAFVVCKNSISHTLLPFHLTVHTTTKYHETDTVGYTPESMQWYTLELTPIHTLEHTITRQTVLVSHQMVCNGTH